jgi:DNA-directed RNA polymerase specialized sigma24 family protein
MNAELKESYGEGALEQQARLPEEFASHWLAIRNHLRHKAPRFDAEDLAQQTFTRAAVSLRNNPDAFDRTKGEPLQWLRHIANNVIRDEARKERTRPSVGGSGGDDGDDGEGRPRSVHRWTDRETMPKPKPLTVAQHRAASRAEHEFKFRRALINNGLPIEGDVTTLRRMLDECNARWRAGVRTYLARIATKSKRVLKRS